ncbi:hypothetical protein CQW23_22904 [Capsicum baccatum]|uniref:F-box associated beta-propeller type 3 domain-containing protein n=1 Tax=Capsicum baccatum TaxID=33114 RepID=A0A2G2W276_CAPBA|nr:hypothetical protein CQW23_22904 [Capsicum baccatum]
MTREGATKLLVRKSEGFYIMEQSENGKASRWNFDNLHYDHVMYANGLFCIWNQDVESVRICNLSTREVIRLSNLRKPPRSIDFDPSYNYSLGYEPEENKYKILMTCDASLGATRNWVFTLGRIWSPCGDDFVSSEEELPCGGDFVSSEEELSCGDDFVTLEEELYYIHL